VEKFCNPKVELSPDKISPMAMGYMFEDLIRRFNEKTNAAAGRHFTPREIIGLMTHLVYLPVKDKIQKGTFLVYDPCAGSGAMLTQSKLFATNPEGEIKSTATFHLYGQENAGEMYAVCKSDMLLKGEDLIGILVKSRKLLPNASYFAFTATPKNKTLELFGVPFDKNTGEQISAPAGRAFRAFHLYSMKQAIEEGFIMDVLQNYTTCQSYYALLKKIEDDPEYDKLKAQKKLKHYVESHEHAVKKKTILIVEHFMENAVRKKTNGRFCKGNVGDK